jgi:hypothetical protein
MDLMLPDSVSTLCLTRETFLKAKPKNIYLCHCFSWNYIVHYLADEVILVVSTWQRLGQQVSQVGVNSYVTHCLAAATALCTQSQATH